MSGIFNNDYRYTGFTPDKNAHSSLGIPALEEDKYKDKAIILPTVLKVTSDEIDYWTKMTCFYDKYWEFTPSFSTVPISFMYITNITESITAQGAEKRVIVYEAPKEGLSDFSFNASITAHPAYKNNLEVIMDNVIVQPKQYQMEVIVPDSLIGPYHKQGLRRLEALIEHMERTEAINDATALTIEGTLRAAQIFIDVTESASKVADLILGSTEVGSSQMATINKNSLEAMASKGHVVLFKKFTGYDYSYGILTKAEFAKKPSEIGVYRGVLTFQETPILNISKKKASSLTGISSTLSEATEIARIINLGLSLPFLKLTGVMDEAGPVGSKTGGEQNISNTLGGLF